VAPPARGASEVAPRERGRGMRRAARASSPLDFVTASDAPAQDVPPRWSEPLAPPETVRLGDEIAFTWPGHGVTLSFGPLHEHR
jgi:hypothetical protein